MDFSYLLPEDCPVSGHIRRPYENLRARLTHKQTTLAEDDPLYEGYSVALSELNAGWATFVQDFDAAKFAGVMRTYQAWVPEEQIYAQMGEQNPQINQQP
jgi:hypothetical protein